MQNPCFAGIFAGPKPIRQIIVLAALIGTAVSCVVCTANGVRRLPPKLGEMPKISLSPRPPLTDGQARHIKDLIASLASLDKPDFGLSATLSGTNFLPIPGREHAAAMLLTDHGLGQSKALQELVAIGPDALPFLVDALDDTTPTRIVIEHDNGIGVMSFARELEMNSVNPCEAAVCNQPADKDNERKIVQSYTVKVGDVCFVAIGQIVGRGYQAVRYQPTACIVLNSPTADAKLCERVRTIWKSDDSRRRLLDSLCADYATVGTFNGDSLDGWDEGNERECEAAMRLLYYFPKESEALLASRLEKLNVAKDVGLDDYEHRCVGNRVRSEAFIQALAWSNAPAIRTTTTGIFKRANQIEDLLASLPAIEDKKLIQSRLETQLNALPAEDPGPYGDGNKLLTALLDKTPATAKAMFDRYLQHPSAGRCHTVCLVLRGQKMIWDVDLLLPMLADKRTFGWDYPVVAGQNEPRLPIRLCDEAAVTLSQNHAMLKFAQVGDYKELDRQIVAMRKTLN